jgi:hypothetical protein
MPDESGGGRSWAAMAFVAWVLVLTTSVVF